MERPDGRGEARMPTAGTKTRLTWFVAIGLAVAAACGTGSNDDGCVPVDAIFLSSEMYCPVPCATWTNRVVPQLPWHTGERFRLKPDYSSSPPRAEITVGELFHANVSPHDMQPSGCNKGFDGPYTYRSTDPNVFVAQYGVDVYTIGAVYEGVGPGTARVIVDMPTPSGGFETVEMTICSVPDADPSICPRVPLDIQVVP
jgi:hypothetical protein